MVQMQIVYLVQPIDTTNYSVKIRRKLVRTQTIKSKGIE